MDYDKMQKSDKERQGKDNLEDRIFPRQVAEEIRAEDLEKVNGGVGGTCSCSCDCDCALN